MGVRRHSVAIVGTALVVLLTFAAGAGAKFSDVADPGSASGKAASKCYRAIVKAQAKYQATLSKTIERCKQDVVKKGAASAFGSLAGCAPLPAKLQTKADTARAKMARAIAKACGGKNAICSAADAGADADVPLADVNWDAGCANLRDNPSGQGSGSTFDSGCNTIVVDDCADIGTCIACQTEFGVEIALDDFLADRLDPTAFGASAATARVVNKCQQSILKAGSKFLAAKRKALLKCWDGKIKRKDGFADADPCPDTDPRLGAGGEPKTVGAIRKLEQKLAAKLCKKCGGLGDGDRDGVCDVPDAPVDFLAAPFACPPADVPPSAVDPHRYPNACSAIGSGPDGTVANLQEYIDCLGCLLEYAADCLALTANGDADPALGIEYPADCGEFGAP